MTIYSIAETRSRFKCNPCSSFFFSLLLVLLISPSFTSSRNQIYKWITFKLHLLNEVKTDCQWLIYSYLLSRHHIGSDLSPLYPSDYKKISLQFPFPWTTGTKQSKQICTPIIPFRKPKPNNQ